MHKKIKKSPNNTFEGKQLKSSSIKSSVVQSKEDREDDEFNAEFNFLENDGKFPSSEITNQSSHPINTQHFDNGESDILEKVIAERRALLASLSNSSLTLNRSSLPSLIDSSMPQDNNEFSEDDENPDIKNNELEKITPSNSELKSFSDFQLSRPLLKAISTQLGFVQPTPIQSAAISIILSGRDVCGCAVTGSGKTAAFAIPSIERLLQAQIGSRISSATRVLVLLPTRELAFQCVEVWKSLIFYTKLSVCLVVGGLPITQQEAELRKLPDIIIATPGRLVDLLQNSSAISLDSIEVLILDEADRMLEDGFADELNFIIKSCPRQRQTMLFSATLHMSVAVDGLARLSLLRPIQLQINSSEAIASKLTQEFIRVRSASEDHARDALLLSLLEILSYQEHKENDKVLRDPIGIIVFFPSKEKTHRVRIILGLKGIFSSINELHGDLTQAQRTISLGKFKKALSSRKDSILLCTDVAARGLDIPGVTTVINWSLPLKYTRYQHRIGRTARAGRSGRSISLVGESDRKVLRMAIKNGSSLVSQRTIPNESISESSKWISSIEDQVVEIIVEEKEQKKMFEAERDLKRAQNLVLYAKEIQTRPKRTFIQRKIK